MLRKASFRGRGWQFGEFKERAVSSNRSVICHPAIFSFSNRLLLSEFGESLADEMVRRGNITPITGWRAIALLPVSLPLALFAKLFSPRLERTPAEVAGYIRDFVEGTGGEWDWDDFVSIPIADPMLDRIRIEAESVQLPITESGMKTLENLLRRADAIKLEWLGAKKAR
jgi:hypothetical protein